MRSKRVKLCNSHHQDMVGYNDAGKNSGVVRKELKLLGLHKTFVRHFKQVGVYLGFDSPEPLQEGDKLVPNTLEVLSVSGWLGAYMWTAAQQAKGTFLTISEAELISNTTQKLTEKMV